MNNQTLSSKSKSLYRFKDMVFIVIGTLLLCSAISNASLWYDESLSAMLAAQPSLKLWFHSLMAINGSEPQMPGYLLYLWVCAKFIGTREWALRLANLPWAALLACSLAWGEKSGLWSRRVWLVLCLSPFAWFYMNEARPYMMVISLSMVIVVALLSYSRDPVRYHHAPWVICGTLLVLCSVHMLTIPIIPSLIILLYLTRTVKTKDILRAWWRPVLATLPGFVSLAIYYLYTLRLGKGGLIERPGPLNLVFAIYEFLGFGGLGPPRNAMRQAPSLHLFIPYLPTFCLGIFSVGVALFVIVLHLNKSGEKRAIYGLCLAFVVGTLLTLGLSYKAHFRMLGRHVAADFALLAAVLLIGLAPASSEKIGKLSLTALLLVGVAWTVSDFRLRFLASYQKDDYRDAVAIARQALSRGEAVIWLADVSTASYYHLRTDDGSGFDAFASSDEPAIASETCSPYIFDKVLHGGRNVTVIISDRDVSDSSGDCKRILQLAKPKHLDSPSTFNVWSVAGR